MVILNPGCMEDRDISTTIDTVYEKPDATTDAGRMEDTLPQTTTTFKTTATGITTTTVKVTIRNSTTTTTTPAQLAIPTGVLENCIGFLAGAPEELTTIRLAGGGWARPHPGPFSWSNIEPEEGRYDFTVSDSWVKTGQENNVALVATIWPYSLWDQAKCRGRECEVTEKDQFYPRKGEEAFSIPKSRCRPCDLQAYGHFVENLVERYDGDGIADMPGLEMPVRYWEAGNEPFLKAEDLTFFKGTPMDYLEILKATYVSVKKACPECKVLHAGAAHIQPEELSSWRVVFQNDGIDYFDIANIHYISSGDKSTMNVRDFDKLVEEFGEKPIWLTEAEIKTVSELNTMTEGALNAGAEKILYTTLDIGSMGPPRAGQYTPEYRNMKNKC